MGVEILYGDAGACFYCNTTDWCFGPLMKDCEQAELFLSYLKSKGVDDPRMLKDGDLVSYYSDFIAEFSCGFCGVFHDENVKLFKYEACVAKHYICKRCAQEEPRKKLSEHERRGLEFVPFGQDED